MNKSHKAGSEPIAINVIKGKNYAWCSCGLSKTLPFCDNEHRAYNEQKGTNYKSVKIIAQETVMIDLNSSTWK